MTSSILGISARATAGKSTFVKLLADLVYAQDKRIVRDLAFAHALKAELDPVLTRDLGISAFTANAEHKRLIRPFLVERGAGARKTDPDHWIKLLEPLVKEALARGEVVGVSDVRYTNEANWVHSLGGKVVYIERLLPSGEPVPPANQEEAEQDGLTRACCDLTITWPTLPLDRLRPYVQDVWTQLNT